MNEKRIRNINQNPVGSGKVIYWMSRDLRIYDNWAVVKAVELAERHQKAVEIVYVDFGNIGGAVPAILRQRNDFLRQAKVDAEKMGIKFVVKKGDPVEAILHEYGRAGVLVCDFSPLRTARSRRDKLARQMAGQVVEVDAHNIVPAWLASDKKEFGAYTFRPKILKSLSEYLDDYPSRFASGQSYAIPQQYGQLRNDPNDDGQSGLSPKIHFGAVSVQSVAKQIKDPVFLEELVVRRELAENFCLYEKNYDNFDGFPEWARKTLDKHRSDKREYLYTREEFEKGQTHDPLWNAAQLQMVATNKMHGYMRMYWAKKILEWTRSPEEALQITIYLNDKYELDGRDANGYAGAAWSIGGVHDRPWIERPVFGQIRYMNFNGCKRKFDVDLYIKTWTKT